MTLATSIALQPASPDTSASDGPASATLATGTEAATALESHNAELNSAPPPSSLPPLSVAERTRGRLEDWTQWNRLREKTSRGFASHE